jgi:hypothetical protein
MRKSRSWHKSLIVLAIAVAAFVAVPVAQAQQVFVHGAVVALQGTPHLWIADEQGVLHWGGDTRALADRHVNWSARIEVSLDGLRALETGDPWLSAGLLKDGDPIYLVKWETEWPQPRLLHIQSIADVELFGINETNYGNFVLDIAAWEARYGMSVAGLERAELPAAVASAATSTQAPAGTGYQSINGFGAGDGTLNLPQGDVALKLQFGAWAQEPVTVTYQIGGGEPVRLIDDRMVVYQNERTISVPQAGAYTFSVTTTRDWRIWIGVRPSLESVPLPLGGCIVNRAWRMVNGVNRAQFLCGGVRLDGTSYDEVNTADDFWVVWSVSGKYHSVTSTGTLVVAEQAAVVSFQTFSGYNGGYGTFDLPMGNVTVTIEYDDWANSPITVTYQAPGGALMTLVDNARVGYSSRWVLNAPVAGKYTVRVGAMRSWKVSVGAADTSLENRLGRIGLPVDESCSTTDAWKETDGVYQARFKCPTFELDGMFYPGLITEEGIWVVWNKDGAHLDVTFHKDGLAS